MGSFIVNLLVLISKLLVITVFIVMALAWCTRDMA